uniref:Dysfunctional tapetum 1 n=1 Tax=Tapiscia sinensis TaxID=112844 RepID=A0A1Y0B6D2_9ROSI|nr:dysfunctional tapetum 1 [Tapiscia sinensis]
MEFACSALDELCITEEGAGKPGRMGRRSHSYEIDTTMYKSKNLHAERRRRQKLSDRLLALRALVPIITNMNKATIIKDAITYIQELQMNVKVLSDQLLEMEAYTEQGAKPRSDEVDAAEEMKKRGIKEDVKVTNIDGNKLWIKIIFEKKRGGFTKLLEAMTYLGFELTDTSVTTSKGATLVSSCVEGTYGDMPAAQQAREMLLEIIRGI